jgi:hypothetical protein
MAGSQYTYSPQAATPICQIEGKEVEPTKKTKSSVNAQTLGCSLVLPTYATGGPRTSSHWCTNTCTITCTGGSRTHYDRYSHNPTPYAHRKKKNRVKKKSPGSGSRPQQLHLHSTQPGCPRTVLTPMEHMLTTAVVLEIT